MSDEPGTLARIMVVDDSKLIARAAQRMLGSEFDVIIAVDGVDAFEKLERDPQIQAVFSDLDMPNCDGYELLQRIRTAADPGLQAMPVIIVTGASDDESKRLKSLELGATDFITKPFAGTDLLARARVHSRYQRVTKLLQAQSTLDPLTGLANKTGFLNRLQQDIAYARRHQHAITLVRVEIDDMRAFFLKRGKAAAEKLVLHVARLLQVRIRNEDTAGRIGLGGFALSFPGGELKGIESMLGRLHADITANPPTIDGESMPLAISTAALSAELQHWPSAQEALDRCQALLDGEPAPAAMPGTKTKTASKPAAAPTTAKTVAPEPTPVAPPPPRPVAPPAPAPPPIEAALAEPMRLDPLLDLVRQGETQEAIEKMPQIIQRLVPFLRLLTANQRGQLIRFLQKLGE
jgi:diguanylate cyclase (GGDEF)-like protein